LRTELPEGGKSQVAHEEAAPWKLEHWERLQLRISQPPLGVVQRGKMSTSQ
jgi:hypothetical protein